MPSKSKKKKSRPASPPSSSVSSRPLHSNQALHTSSAKLSSSTSSPPSPNTVADLSKEELLNSLEEASIKYPSLIGKTAVVCRVIDVVDALGSDGNTVWLSESVMFDYPIKPGSTVSVSLGSMNNRVSGNFPLSSLPDECARHFGFNSTNFVSNEVGNYFVLATVQPSSKILENGIRLSSDLSFRMGCPSSERAVFVFPIHVHPIMGHINFEGHGSDATCISLYDCKEIDLALVYSKIGIAMNKNLLHHTNVPTAASRVENGSISSPKMSLFSHSKFSPSSTSNSTSSSHDESKLAPCNTHESFSISFDLEETLEDKGSKKILQDCCRLWLHSRSLLCGNLVILPLVVKLCFFQVTAANKIYLSDVFQSLTNESYHSLLPEVENIAHLVNDAFIVHGGTQINICSPSCSGAETQQNILHSPDFGYEDTKAKPRESVFKLGGLAKEYSVLKDVMVSSALKSTLPSLGLRPTKGVLLHGPPGTGKTSLAQCCAHDAGVNLFFVNGPEIVCQFSGESERALQEVFDSASSKAPAVVFIDELDAIAPARRDGGEDLSQRMVATLLNLMDGIGRMDGLLVIAASNRPDSIEPALRRPGRFDREIEIGVPSSEQRHEILHTLLSEMEHCLQDSEIQDLALTTHGFVGADLVALCKEAALGCLRRYINCKSSNHESQCNKYPISGGDIDVENFNFLQHKQDMDLSTYSEYASSTISGFPVSVEPLSENEVNSSFMMESQTLRITFGDFKMAKAKVRPSAMREVILEVPKVHWEDVGGQREVKMQLIEAVEWPQKHRDSFRRIGTRPPTGVLMFGPPGCSKTLLARAVASEAGLNFLAVKGPELFSKWVGESEKAIRSLFAKARANAPSIIFFDEIDGLAVVRGKESNGVSVADRVMSQLLVELDGLHQRVNVTVIAATNRPDKIDSALLRPGRFDRLLYVGPPNQAEREDIFRVHLRKMHCSADVCIRELSFLSEEYTGADISLVCREAAVAAMEESLDASEVTMEHLKIAIEQVQPTEIQSYQELSKKFQRLVCSTSTGDKHRCQPQSSQPSFRNRIKYILSFFYYFPAVYRWSMSTSGS